MISWITVATTRGHRDQLAENLAAGLDVTRDGDWTSAGHARVWHRLRGSGPHGWDELIVVTEAQSIAQAYNRGQALATKRNPIRCFVHADVEILNLPDLRAALVQYSQPSRGMVGVTGSFDAVVPWWEGRATGSVQDSRLGLLDFGRGGTPVAYLDGLLLATARHDIWWDESYPGWHLYDHDQCQQQMAAGRANWCLPDGAGLVRHNTAGSTDVAKLVGWDAGVARFREKWAADLIGEPDA